VLLVQEHHINFVLTEKVAMAFFFGVRAIYTPPFGQERCAEGSVWRVKAHPFVL
jgi:hypothetical protein